MAKTSASKKVATTGATTRRKTTTPRLPKSVVGAVHAVQERMDAERVERRCRVDQDADVGPEGPEAMIVLAHRHLRTRGW